MTHASTPTPLTQVQRYILQRLRDAGKPMVLVGGSACTQLARFHDVGEWGLTTRVSVIEMMIGQGYIVRVDEHRCQLTQRGADAIRRVRQPLPRS